MTLLFLFKSLFNKEMEIKQMHSKKPINCFKFRKLCSTTLQTQKTTTYILHTSNEKFIQRVGDELRHKKLRSKAQCWKRSIGVNQIKRRWKKRVDSQYVQWDLNNKSKSRGEIKLQIFWEGHKNWKKSLTLFWHYEVHNL